MADTTAKATQKEECWSELEQLDDWLRGPMLFLSFAWLVLVLAELTWGNSQIREAFTTAIWVIFILEFALRLALARKNGDFCETTG